jgi:DNA (cytosine-5)-methyltransferase 1
MQFKLFVKFIKLPQIDLSINETEEIEKHLTYLVILIKLREFKRVSEVSKNLKAVDFFCCGGGMTYGFQQAGIDVIAGIDIDPKCKETYEFNNPSSKFIEADIKKLTELELIEKTQIKKDDDNLIFIGCSPCQYWSIIKTDKTKSKEAMNLLTDFQKFVDYFNPGFVVIENVPGIFSKPESPLKDFIDFLKKKGYASIEYQVLKVSEYGVPQNRKRFVLIASRVKNLVFPKPKDDKTLTVRNFIGDEKLFPKISEGNIDETDFCHTTAGLEDDNLQRLTLTPINGGTRESWKDTEYQLKVYKLKDGKKNFSFKDTYGRMFWDKPASTITTKFFSISNGRFAHPEQNRAISIREGATLQTFPTDYVFKVKSIADKARLIGNAVPPELAKRIADSLVSN